MRASFSFFCLYLTSAFSSITQAALAAFHIGFDKARFDVAASTAFPVSVRINPVPESGLYSFGIRLFIAGANGAVVEQASISVPGRLDYHGIRESQATRASA